MTTQKFCIYIHINTVNHKVYIGQTCRKPEYRWSGGDGYKTQLNFYRDIEFYGWNNFDHFILKDNLTQEEANYWEEYYIQRYDSGNEALGYNLRSTGHYSSERPFLKEDRVHGNGKMVKCLNTGEIFPTVTKAMEWCGLKSQTGISKVCHGERKSAGKHPITGEYLQWEYIEK